MKNSTYTKSLLIGVLALLGTSGALSGAGSHDGHDHGAHEEGSGHDHHSHVHGSHGQKAAPNGGRLITSVEPHLEFLATPERFVQITFIGHDGAMVPAAGQSVSLIGGNRSAPTKLEFVKKEGKLISTKALPEIKNMPIVLQVQVGPDSKKVREKFYLNLSDCGSCDYKEYACTCGH